jgi:AraC family transcriptional regulator
MDSHYCVCQRLSDNHAPLRIGNINAREAFPRVRSVGFLPPGYAVRLYPLDGPFRVLNCAFEKSYFENIAEIGQDQWEEHTNALVAIRERRLEMLMQEIYGELVQPDFGRDILIEAASTMILVELARYGRRLSSCNRQSQPGQGLAPWQLRRIHDRLDAALELGYPTLDELSQLCGISQSHLMRTFKASTGWPIHKYVAEERLKAAKQMLVDEHLNSKEIAGKLGFRSAAYFATAFRRMTGKTPSQFRREARAQEFLRH